MNQQQKSNRRKARRLIHGFEIEKVRDHTIWLVITLATLIAMYIAAMELTR